MQPQPVFHAEYVEQRSRLTTFFRLLLAIPHFVVLFFYGIAAAICVFVAWFALLFTGRYPAALYELVAGYQRYSTAVYGYTTLLTDAYPPFGPDTDNYPVRIDIPPPKPEYNRLKVLFRIFLAIPIAVVVYAMQIVYQVGALLAWFAIVILGKQPKGLQEMIELGVSYQQRAYAYFALLTEDWPPFSNPQPALPEGPAPSGLPPSAHHAPAGSFAPPTATEAPPERPV
jgi:hypothetical protein